MFESLPCKLMWKPALDAWEAYTGKTWSLSVQQTTAQDQTNQQTVAEAGVSQVTHSPSEIAKLSMLCASVLLSSEKKRRAVEGDRTTFRVTCTRTGRKHTVSSMEVAKHFGSGVYLLFGWKVQLTHPDIEVLLSITDNDCLISISLTQDSRHLRNITHFGPTTLRSTIAYGLVR